MLRLKERYHALVDVQVVAFLQSGILRDPGTANLLDAAGIDGDVRGHLHDPGPLGAFELRDVAAASPFSHAYALGAIDDGVAGGRTGSATP